jgi:hypothetical protein
MGKKYGFSFSLSRLIGLAALKGKIARSTGIPLTKLGRQRKVGQFILDKLIGKKH